METGGRELALGACKSQVDGKHFALEKETHMEGECILTSSSFHKCTSHPTIP